LEDFQESIFALYAAVLKKSKFWPFHISEFSPDVNVTRTQRKVTSGKEKGSLNFNENLIAAYFFYRKNEKQIQDKFIVIHAFFYSLGI